MRKERLPYYYEVLELPPSASSAEIKKAWLEQMQVWHPDRFAHSSTLHRKAEARTQMINQAYQTLSDPFARTRYDATTRKSSSAKPSRPSAPPRPQPTPRPRQEVRGRRIELRHALALHAKQSRGFGNGIVAGRKGLPNGPGNSNEAAKVVGTVLIGV